MSATEPKLISSGPVFEPEPGWGFSVKKWFKKYFWKIILPIIVIIIAVVSLAKKTEQTASPNSPTPSLSLSTEIINEIVKRGDSRTHLARRALADYLTSAPENLTAGQRVFIETKLRESVSSPLTIGMTVKFQITEIQSAIGQAKQLSPTELKKWEIYARQVRF